MRAWRAYYRDGTVYDSRRIEWRDLPADGVALVVEFQDQEYKPGWPYRRIIDGCDWYWIEDGRVRGVRSGDWGTWQPKPAGVPDDLLKRGVGMSDLSFEILSDRAWRDRQCL